MRRAIAIIVFAIAMMMYPLQVQACPCAVTMVADLMSDGTMSVKDLYGEPLHCSTGPFSVEQEKRIVQVNWIKMSRWLYTVNIFLPLFPIVGEFQVHYCWGDNTARVGSEVVPVVLVTQPIYLVRTEISHVEN